jgi:hypothetical protein
LPDLKVLKVLLVRMVRPALLVRRERQGRPDLKAHLERMALKAKQDQREVRASKGCPAIKAQSGQRAHKVCLEKTVQTVRRERRALKEMRANPAS